MYKSTEYCKYTVGLHTDITSSDCDHTMIKPCHKILKLQ